MPWNERQRAMLHEMGLRVWTPAAAVPASAGSGPAAAAGAMTSSAGSAPAARAPMPPQAESGARTSAQAPQPPWQTTRPVAREPSREPSRERSLEPTRAAAPEPGVPAPAAGLAAAPLDAGALEAVARLEWPGLRQAVADCRACRLCESRKQTVFGVGHPQAHWMIVGEAPGAQEDELGEPFVGAAGQLLDAMLRALGLDRTDEGDPAARVFIANTLKCRPPGNRNPQPDEMQRCEPFLVRQIQLVRPRIILAMGRFAVQALLRTNEPIGRLRGRVHRYQDVPLVVTYHPAYLLRNLPDKARAWEDLCMAADLMDEEPH